MRFSSLTGKYHYIPMRVPVTLPSDTLKCFSWASHLCAYQYSAEYSNETLLRSLNSLSRMQPSLLWYLVPWTPAFFIFSFPSSISPTEEVHQTLTGLPLPVLWPEHTLKAVNWGNHSTHITSFPPDNLLLILYFSAKMLPLKPPASPVPIAPSLVPSQLIVHTSIIAIITQCGNDLLKLWALHFVFPIL